jgi:hypothetical protein
MSKRKFSPAEVLRIRTSRETSGVLADKLGVSTSCICKIRNGWVYKEVKHVPRNVGLSP